MIVYGDQEEVVSLDVLRAVLVSRLSSIEQAPDHSTRLEALRTILIACGQIEQAAHDYLNSILPGGANQGVPAELTPFHTATLAVARVFCFVCSNPNSRSNADLIPLLDDIRSQVLEQSLPPGAKSLVAKLPEGFALYALYPEQYIGAAQRWLDDHQASDKVAVIGIRSIGTTLAALVAAVLAAKRVEAACFSVRPAGHPFSRTLSIEQGLLSGVSHVLVVDEGPGLSGSSMSAVSRAAQAAGIPEDRIAFLPGHGGLPGGAGSDEVLETWIRAKRYPASSLDSDPLVEGRPLSELLQGRLMQAIGAHDLPTIEWAGSGLWRQYAYMEQANWPAVCSAFERPTYLCKDSGGTTYAWEFMGLALLASGFTQAEQAVEQISARAEKGWCFEPVAVSHGFVCVQWPTGSRLAPSDASPTVGAQLGRYIADASASVFTEDNWAAAHHRLAELLYWNTWEVMGEAAADRAKRLFVAPRFDPAIPCHGDGRMAPHRWCMVEGRLQKVNASAAWYDHTAVGKQPVSWDLAGACVEWRLDEHARSAMIHGYHDAGGRPMPHEAAIFYQAAYLAFKMGQARISWDMLTNDPGEQARLWQAFSGYKDILVGLLA